MTIKETLTLDKLLPNWRSLDYNSADNLTSALAALRHELYPKWIENERKKYLEGRDKREKSKSNFNKNILPKILEWVEKNLKSGDVVKFDGCRDQGYREVIEVDLKSETILCWQLYPYRGNNGIKGKLKKQVFQPKTP